jgi:hypothetical protein
MRSEARGAIRWDEDPAPGRCQGSDLRCGCGNLLARVVGGEVELKCRRCKRLWRVPIAGAAR